MRVDLGAKVRTRDGKDVGSVDQLIMDPDTNEVKAAVIRKGFLLPRDVEVPLDTLTPGHEGEVRLSYTADQVDKLPDFYESNYTPTPPSGFVPPAGYPATGFFWPLSYGWAMPTSSSGNSTVDREIEAALRRQDLQNAVVDEGSDVIDREGKKVGTVHELTFDPASGRLARFVVREGVLLHKNVTLPASLVERVDDGAIFLRVKGDELPTAD